MYIMCNNLCNYFTHSGCHHVCLICKILLQTRHFLCNHLKLVFVFCTSFGFIFLFRFILAPNTALWCRLCNFVLLAACLIVSCLSFLFYTVSNFNSRLRVSVYFLFHFSLTCEAPANTLSQLQTTLLHVLGHSLTRPIGPHSV